MRRLALAGLMLLACGRAPDARCSAENCAAALAGCEVAPPGMPNMFICQLGGLTSPATFADELPTHCADACHSAGFREEVACLAGAKRACEGINLTSDRATFASQCIPQKNTNAACVKRCHDLANACDRACPTDTWAHCFSCIKSCGLNRAACLASCVTQ